MANNQGLFTIISNLFDRAEISMDDVNIVDFMSDVPGVIFKVGLFAFVAIAKKSESEIEVTLTDTFSNGKDVYSFPGSIENMLNAIA